MCGSSGSSYSLFRFAGQHTLSSRYSRARTTLHAQSIEQYGTLPPPPAVCTLCRQPPPPPLSYTQCGFCKFNSHRRPAAQLCSSSSNREKKFIFKLRNYYYLFFSFRIAMMRGKKYSCCWIKIHQNNFHLKLLAGALTHTHTRAARAMYFYRPKRPLSKTRSSAGRRFIGPPPPPTATIVRFRFNQSPAPTTAADPSFW